NFYFQLEDFWNEDLNLETANNNEYNIDNGLSVSYCISNAISEMNRTQEINLDPESKLLLEKLKSSGNNNNNIVEKNHLGNHLCNNVALFLLRIGSFVIVKFKNLESLSYVSLKIFFHIDGAIFSAIRDQFYIFSHVEALHIVYYLASSDISINEKVLVLKEQAKGL
ncbi:21475_t:CDS:2, partial [Dentiscutata erythropus]